jgi:hypothetical protein
MALEAEVEVELAAVVAAAAALGAGARGGGAGQRSGGGGRHRHGAVAAPPPVEQVDQVVARGARLVRRGGRAGEERRLVVRGEARARGQHAVAARRSRRRRGLLVRRVELVDPTPDAGAVGRDGERRRWHGGVPVAARVRVRWEDAASARPRRPADAGVPAVLRRGARRRGSGGRGRHVQVGVPTDAPLLLVRVLVSAQRLRLEELLVAEEAREQAHFLAVHAHRHCLSVGSSSSSCSHKLFSSAASPSPGPRRRRQVQRQVGRLRRRGGHPTRARSVCVRQNANKKATVPLTHSHGDTIW